MSRTVKWMTLVCVTVGLASGPARAAASGGAGLPVIDSRDFAAAAKTAAVGSRLRLENVAVSDADPAALVLERFEVFAQGATVTLHGAGGDRVIPAPANAYFRGVIDGRPESRAFLALLADGSTQGILEDAGATYLIGAEGAPAKALGGPLTMQRVDPALLKSARNSGFRCANDRLQPSNVHAQGLDFTPAPAVPVDTAALPGVTAAATYGAKVAIETDVEFLQLFNNNTTTATNYIGNLIGYASTIYTAEINTGLAVQSVSLWTGGTDPWTQNDTQCGLMEFGKYWNVNKTGVTRTIAHFMSGKANGGGIAWVGVLCSGAFNTNINAGTPQGCPALGTESTPWGGGYGYTGNLQGTFNINNPTVVWDIDAVAHEIGHNFNSPHSHCYNGIGGNASPIDQCISGECKQNDQAGNCVSFCYVGATSLPGPQGAGSGTIMSYCHLMTPGMSNIKLTFGNTETFGVAPTRESARMSSYVVSVATGGQSACLAPVGSAGGIFSDGFEGGIVPGPWSSKTP